MGILLFLQAATMGGHGDRGNHGPASGLTTEQSLTLVIAGLSLLVALAATVLSVVLGKASDRTAREALDDARLARREAVELALWTGALEAVMRLVGFDPAREPAGTKLVDLRVHLTLLVDQFDTWEGLGEWLGEEIALGGALATEIMEQAQVTDTPLDRLAKTEHYTAWAVALGSNLRLLRRRGYRPKIIAYLRGEARATRESVYADNGWGDMPEGIPGIKPIPEEIDDLPSSESFSGPSA